MPRYEFVEGSSSKFWEIKLQGTSFTTTFGKIGSGGQTKLKEYKTEAAAKAEYDKLIAEKTKKGYVAAGGKAAPKPNGKAAKPAKEAKAAKPTKSAGQYFEFKDGSSSKFWEIAIADKTYTVRFGKIGADGQTSAKTLKTVGEARAEHDKLVSEKLKKGYKLVRGEAPTVATVHARNEKLEAAIAADPDNADAYLVYADWLQGQGDPRGELIVLQHANKKPAVKKLLDQNKEHFFGKMWEAQDMLAAYDGKSLGRDTTWRWGYIEALWISNKRDRDSMYGTPSLPEIDPEEALGWMLDHPSCRFLRELTVGIISYDGNGYDGVAKVIGARKLPSLKKLTLGDFYYEETELNWSNMGNLEPMYKAMPNLESLTLRSGTMRVGKIDLPKLKELTIISGGFDKKSLATICAAKWPHLETLSIQLGDETAFKVKDLAPIFDGKAFPKVKHLGLGNSSITDDICKGLAASKIAAQLESLDLSKGTMGDAGAEALAAGRFPKLQSLDVTDGWMSKKGIALLGKVAKKIEHKGGKEGQQDDGGDPENRYIAARE